MADFTFVSGAVVITPYDIDGMFEGAKIYESKIKGKIDSSANKPGHCQRNFNDGCEPKNIKKENGAYKTVDLAKESIDPLVEGQRGN